ncbi:cell surface protein SprA [Cyclobacteriaceae bacterium]|nr:cell surface protein SprA [Cyclobacteriaceae bacterium]
MHNNVQYYAFDRTVNPPEDTVFSDRQGDPHLSEPQPESPFIIPPPSNVKPGFEIDKDYNYTYTEKVGDRTHYRAPSTMTFEQFMEMKRREMIKDHWRTKAKTQKDSTRTNNDPLEYGLYKPGGEPIVTIRPAGTVTLSLGGKWQRTENPAFPVNQQRTGGIDFDQQISLSLAGKVGERVKVEMNWDTKAAFDFDNNFKVSYEGRDYDIIKDLQIGNVSMPVDNSLIKGAQNLFGVKTKMQFGKLDVTAVVSQQRGVTETITIKGGGLARPIDKQASDYEYNRHFFLSQYFKKKFDEAYDRNPTAPNTGVRITRVEVYKTNISNQTEELRTITGLLDLGENGQFLDPDLNNIDNEGYLYNKSNITAGITLVPSNDANDLYARLISSDNNRKTDEVVNYLESLGLVSGNDFEKINSARRLTEGKDFTFHPDLGYVSLNSTLKDDEALAVAFEYTLNGVTYKVGELPEDYQAKDQVEDVIFLKLLKPQSINTSLPTWSLMMKNIYSLNTSNVQPDKFQLRVIYKDDLSGVDNPSLQEGQDISGVPLLRLLNLDKLDANGDFKPDGNFDFLDRATIDVARGKIIFPVQEPFGKYLTNIFYQNDPSNAVYLGGKYTFQTLYDGTQNDARQKTSRDKYFLNGSYQSASSTDIRLPGINIAEGSVSITVGSQTLSEGSDFSVDYQFGVVKILNTGVLASGKDILIRYEKSDLFNVRAKSLIGTRLAYNFSEKFKVGFTWMYLNEKPFLTRVNIGSEPIRNTQLGLDVKFKDKSRVITKIVDALPGYNSTKESVVDMRWEVAALKPGHSKVIGETGTSYIDDFEGAATPYDFTRSPFSWKISSVPFGHADYGLDSTLTGFHRGKLSWFTVDQSFFQSNNNNAGFSLTDQCIVNNFTRGIVPQEIFVNRNPNNGGIILNQAVLDFAYYPKERGPYNYNTNNYSIFNGPNGNIALYDNPEENWASVVRPITFDTDFEKANIEYLEFWVMSPFTPEGSAGAGTVHEDLREEMERTVPYPVYTGNTIDGTLSFHLGEVNEDVLKDGVQSFENGLPDDNARETPWGDVTRKQFITNAFDNSQDRALQDVGLEGLNNQREQVKHASYYAWATANNLAGEANDPSSDDYEYFINTADDERCILSRYKNYNGLEGNSLIVEGNSTFPQPSYTTPDNEDINQDKTLSFSDRYFQYDLGINANTFSQNGVENNPYIVDRVLVDDNPDRRPVEWYQVRIPLASGKPIGGISNFQTVKFFRMNVEGFAEPVMLRMVELQLVSAQWRRYPRPLDDVNGAPGSDSNDPDFTVGVVNIEQNSTSNGSTSPYRLPPDVVRDLDQTSGQIREQNEQSMLLGVTDLDDGEARAVFKNMAIDMINYDKLEMFVHAEAPGTTTAHGETTVFLRFGTDNEEHYYEVELPLQLSDISSTDPEEIWRIENRFDIKFSDIIAVKLERNAAGFDKNTTYTTTVGKHIVKIKGNPDQSAIRSMMIGLRNPLDGGGSKTVTAWVNELRVTGFNEKVGVATTGEINIQAADLLKISGSMKYVGNNYGDIENTISQRERSNTLQYGTAMNISMDKFLPEKWGLKIPVYASYDRETSTPQYNPLDPDVKTRDAINSFDTEEEKADFKNKVQYNKEVKSVNVTNLRKVSTAKKKKPKKIFSIENFTLSAGYTEENRSGVSSENAAIGNNLQSYKKQNYKGSLGYTYTFTQKPFQPFNKSKLFKSKHLRLIKDFNWNFLPNDFSVKFDLDRTYTRTQLYNTSLTTDGVAPTFEKSFWFYRTYNMSWNFSKNLRLTYKAKASSIVDEPEGDKNGDQNITKDQYQEEVWNNLSEGGRMKDFDQEIKLTYKIPINKIMWLNWINSDASYLAGYKWQAGAENNNDPGPNEYFYGNTASNKQEITLNGKANLVKLYNKSSLLKKINNPPRRRPNMIFKVVDSLGKEKEIRAPDLATAKKRNPKFRSITKINEYKFKVIDTTGKVKEVKARTLAEVQKKYPDAKKIKKVSEVKAGKSTLRLLMMVRNVNASYKQTNSIILPGFYGDVEFLGLDTRMDNFTSFVPFVLGHQQLEGKDGIKYQASQNGWLSPSVYTNQTITQSKKEDLTLKANLEPIKSFKIALTVKQTKTTVYSEVYRREFETSDQDDFLSYNPVMGGSVSMTYITAQTLFKRDNGANVSEVFEQFSNNRATIQQRLGAKDQSQSSLYGDKHQDVMIPAFLAAYSGQNADDVELSRLPKMPLPNWRVDYNGLSKLNVFKKKFSSITLKHAYSSKYDIANYTSSLDYREISSQANVAEITNNPRTNTNGDYVPEFAITEVTIRESFKPLIGVNIRTKSKWSFKVDYNITRNLGLSMANAQVTELSSNDIVLGIGKTWKKGKFRPPFKSKGKPWKALKNELTLKIDLSIKDTKTTQRSLDGVNTVTAGNWNFQLRPNVNYKISKRATLQFYFERTINDPYISTSFRRSTTAAGFRLRFNLQ